MKNTVKKLLKNTVLYLLIASMLLGLVSCGWFTDKKDPVKVDNGKTDTKLPPYTIVKDKYFVKNGNTDYVIVYEPEVDIIQTAVEELSTFFNEATAISLTAYADGSEIPSEKKIISLGNTSYADKASFCDDDMERESFRIVTSNDDLYIVGEGWGVLWGVYELLGYMFNYEYYKEDAYSLNKNVKELNFFSIDHTIVPDITYTPGYHGLSDYNGTINSKRYRLRNERLLMVDYWHNVFTIFDPSVYASAHPDWYSTSNDQLCYTARGNEEERQAMIDVASEYFFEKFMENEEAIYASFSMMDTRTWCSCDVCVAVETRYQAKSAAMLIMSQEIADKVNAKLAEAGDSRHIKIATMVYNASEDIPCKKNEAGEWVLIDPSLDFSDVVPLWAAMSLKNHVLPWSHPENAPALAMLEQLDACFDEFWLWDYGVNFYDYFAPLNVFNNLQEDFELLSEFNIGLHLYQLDHTASNTSAFGGLKIYLLSQLMMDHDQNVEELTENYFKNVYGAGAEELKEIYDQYRLLAIYNSVDHGDVPAWDESIYSNSMLQKDYYPRGLLREWINLLDKAYEDIQPLKSTDVNAYYKYEENIKLESIFVRYIYARIYLTNNNEENIAFKMELYYDVAERFVQVSEGGSPWALAVTLGIDQLLS